MASETIPHKQMYPCDKSSQLKKWWRSLGRDSRWAQNGGLVRAILRKQLEW